MIYHLWYFHPDEVEEHILQITSIRFAYFAGEDKYDEYVHPQDMM
jgi:hypothetical protein